MSWNCLEQTTSIAFVGHVDWQLFIAHKLQPNEIFSPPDFVSCMKSVCPGTFLLSLL